MKKIIIVLTFLLLCGNLFILNIPAHSEQNQDNQASTVSNGQDNMFGKIIEAQKKQQLKVKEFEPKTPISKFMGGFVSAFLIISIPLALFSSMFIYALADDEIWSKIIKFYFIIIAYLLINYVVWAGLNLAKFKYLDIAIAGFLIISAAAFLYLPISLRREKIKQRAENQIPTWLCPKCNNQNHYNNRCWNCKTEKQLETP